MSPNTDPAAHATFQMHDETAQIMPYTLLQGLQAVLQQYSLLLTEVSILYFLHSMHQIPETQACCSKLSMVLLYPALHLVPFTSHMKDWSSLEFLDTFRHIYLAGSSPSHLQGCHLSQVEPLQRPQG